MALNVEAPDGLDQEDILLCREYRNLVFSKANEAYKELKGKGLSCYVSRELCEDMMARKFYNCSKKYKEQGKGAVVNAFIASSRRAYVDIARHAMRKADRVNGKTGKSGKKSWRPYSHSDFTDMFFETENGKYTRTLDEIAMWYMVTRQTIAAYAKRHKLDRNIGDARRKRKPNIEGYIPSEDVALCMGYFPIN